MFLPKGSGGNTAGPNFSPMLEFQVSLMIPIWENRTNLIQEPPVASPKC
jgi:hypothetical protein